MYALHFREELDEPTGRELDALIAKLKAFLLLEHNEDGSHNFTADVLEETITQIIDRYQNEGQWWKKGPWKFDDPIAGNPHVAGLRGPDPPGGTYDNYAPTGIDTSVIIEIEPLGDMVLTGLKSLEGAVQKRLLLLRNRDSSAEITLRHEGLTSLEQYRFDFSGDEDVILGPRQNIWLYYDPGRERWTAAITGQKQGPIPDGDPDSSTRKAQLEFILDGNGSVLTAGVKTVWARVPFDFELNGWDIVSDQNGSIVIDVIKDTYANFPPTGGDSIVGAGTKPNLSAARKNTSANLTSWTTDWLEGDYIGVEIDSVATVTYVYLTLWGRKAN